MLQWMLYRTTNQSGPSVIRYPKAACPVNDPAFSLPIETGRGVFVHKADASICIAFTGSLYHEVIEAQKILSEKEIDADLYNLRFIKPIDEMYLLGILNQYDYFIVVEEGIVQGGIGEYIISLENKNSHNTEIIHLGISDHFVPAGTRAELLHQCKLDGEGIAEQILRISGIAEQLLHIPVITEQIERIPRVADYDRFKTLAAL
jgi:1-deoxy-D-xylulose-5-phosphate synthase